MLVAPLHANRYNFTPKKTPTAAKSSSLTVVVTSTDGKEAARVPLSANKPAVLGNATLELSRDGNTAILKSPNEAKTPSRFLRSGDEFSIGGTSFRVELDENAGSRNIIPSKSTSKKGVTFAKEPIVSTIAPESLEIGTPSVQASTRKSIPANQLRNSTPHPGRLGVKFDSVEEGESTSASQLRNSTPHPKRFGVKFNLREEQQPKPISSLSMRHSTPHPSKKAIGLPPSADTQPALSNKAFSEIKKQAVRAERVIASEKKARLPLLDISMTAKTVYIPRDTIPLSVRKFMAARSKKPAAKAIRPSGDQSLLNASSISSAHSAASTQLKKDIQKEGLRLMNRRTELLEKLESYELDPEAYAQWTVAELEQRVWGLQEEERRAAAEAILVESGHDPRDFVEYTADEIEDWLEREVVRKTQELQRKASTSFQGTRISFGSPASSVGAAHEPSFVVYREEENAPAAPSSAVKSDDETKEQIAEAKVEETLADENDIPSPIKAAAATPCASVVASKTIKVFLPQPDPMTMTCEQIRAELKSRGLKVSGLKTVIAERLAQAMATEMEEEEFLTEGHEFLGKTIIREYVEGVSKAQIVAFLPAVDDDENTARFYVVHEDGDTEVLDFEDAKQALEETAAKQL